MSIYKRAKTIFIDGPIRLINYIKARLLEKSTWLGISAAATAAAALSPPWSYVTVGVAVIIALLPTPNTKKGECE